MKNDEKNRKFSCRLAYYIRALDLRGNGGWAPYYSKEALLAWVNMLNNKYPDIEHWVEEG